MAGVTAPALTRRSLLNLPLAAGFARVALAAKPRFRTAICAYSFRGPLEKKTMSYDDLVHLAVETGTDGLDLTVYWFPDQSDSFLLPLRRLAYRHGVEIYSISIRTDMCQPKPELRAKEAAWIDTWVDTASKLGAGHIRVFGGTVPAGATEDQAAGWCAEVLARAGDYAGKHGVTLGLENHGGITSRAERIVEIVKKVDSPWVGINLDTGNFTRDAYRQIEMILPYAVNAQFKTEIRDADGKNAPSDWERLVKMFAASGYRGYLALEYEAKEDPAVAVPRLMRDLNNLARKYSS
jgi:sugar phosphate isomerase/epimerase